MEEIEELSDLVLDYLSDPSSAGVIFASQNRGIPLGVADSELLQTVELYPEKLPYLIRQQFEDAASGRHPVNVDSGFANFYMTLLATRLAQRLGLGLVTNSNEADRFAIAVSKGKPFSGVGSHSERRHRGRDFRAFGPRRILPSIVAQGMLIELMLEGIGLPTAVEPSGLINFRRRYADELARLRLEVGRLTSDIPNDEPIEALRQLLKDRYRDQVRPALNAVRRAMRGQGWETAVSGLLKTSVMTVPSGALAMLAGIAAPHVLLAVAGTSLVATGLTLFNQRDATLRASPYSYLIALENQWAS